MLRWTVVEADYWTSSDRSDWDFPLCAESSFCRYVHSFVFGVHKTNVIRENSDFHRGHLSYLEAGVPSSAGVVQGTWCAHCSLINRYVHKVVIVFCISLELIKSLLRTSSFLFALTGFCCMTPLGVGIGIGFLEAPSGEYHEFAVSFLQGTLIFNSKICCTFILLKLCAVAPSSTV